MATLNYLHVYIGAIEDGYTKLFTCLYIGAIEDGYHSSR